ncbi:MAG: METTL5 family protein [Promethearchaeota archaeon]
MKKSEFINFIQNLKSFQDPKIDLEQYQTDAIATADLFFHIAFELNDLSDNLIVDLGAGTGNFTIAAILLGCSKVISVDIDSNALKILKENLIELEIEDRIHIIQADLREKDITNEILDFKKENFDEKSKIVVVSNPPFGVHNKGADIVFLSQAFKFADIIYSIHNSDEKTQEYLAKKISKLGGIVSERATLYLMLKKTYKFHSKKVKRIKTDVYRIINKKKVDMTN